MARLLKLAQKINSSSPGSRVEVNKGGLLLEGLIKIMQTKQRNICLHELGK